MTVEALIQTLVELAQRGRWQWEVKVWAINDYGDLCHMQINDVFCEEEKQEVVID